MEGFLKSNVIMIKNYEYLRILHSIESIFEKLFFGTRFVLQNTSESIPKFLEFFKSNSAVKLLYSTLYYTDLFLKKWNRAFMLNVRLSF